MAGTKKDAEKEYSSNWGGRRSGQGRPKGSPNKGTELGRKTIFKSVTISGSPAEVDELKRLANEAGKSVSRFIIESILK